MASGPLSNCCFERFIHSGEPSGQVEEFGGINTYTTGDKNSKKVILFLTDIFGVVLKNNKLVADSLAKGGYYVVMPDIFEGDAIPDPRPENFDRDAWVKRHTVEIVEAIVESSLKAIKEELNPEFIASVGYCFGAKYVVRLLSDTSKIQAGGIAHPSRVTEDEVRAIKSPIIISGAETDQAYPEENRKVTESILQEIGATYFTTLCSGVSHGFAIKGDINNPIVKFAKEKCAQDFIQWFNFVSALKK